MAEDKQLTVAELLAQSGGGAAKDRPRRRRRRSLDDGGISVAELTGSIRRVDATPEQSRHSSVDIDETAPVIPAPQKPAEKAPAPETPEAQAQPATTAEPVKKAESAQDNEDTSVIDKVKHAPAATSTPTAPTSKPQAKPAAKSAAKPAAKADETGVIPTVGAAAGATTTGAAAAGATTAGVADKAGAPGAVKSASTQDRPVQQMPPQDSGRDLRATDSTDNTDNTDNPDAAGTTGAEEGEDDGEKVNVMAVILLAVVGIVLGAVVFKGFELLWARMTVPVVSVLAVAVTGIMVGIVHALRTERDTFSMVLAGIVGLVLTFGPLLIVM